MPLPLEALLCFATALVFSLYGTPVAARAAVRFGIVDVPDGSLKHHRGPIPYLGGLALYVSFILTMALVFDFDQRVLGLLLAGTILVLLGLIDDFGVLGVWPKFLGQGFATLVLIKSDIAIHIGVLPGWANLALTVLWIVGMTNAFNIIDIMDGLASGTALIAAACLLVVATLNGQTPIVMMTATLMGSLLGFLKYNAHPARIFMGDTGSLFLGMMLGSLAMIGKYDRYNEIGYLSPLLILAVPLFDTVYVMTLRLARFKNPFKGSPDHFALRLRRTGMPVRLVVFLSWGAGAALGALAILNLYLDATLSAFLVGGVVIFLVMAGLALSRIPVHAAAAPAGGATTVTLEEPLPDPAVEAARRNLLHWRRR
ncbi:MAG TPA: MraY family glycosyltransferase [Candidatus Polarisedimenticolia bacterium]